MFLLLFRKLCSNETINRSGNIQYLKKTSLLLSSNKYNVLLIKGQRFAILNQYFLKDFREKTRKGKLHHCSHLCSMMIMKERMVSHILRIPEQLKASPMLADLPRPISELCFAARSDVYCYLTDFWQNSFGLTHNFKMATDI